jgi:8-oxo-dGTP pyrophosphatase MutT (NUDIX family)
MRDADERLEVLLLRRHELAGFVPDMYVFPGGRVDPADADPSLAALVDGLTQEEAATRLELRDADPPALAYYLAACREAFEETGILVGSLNGQAPPCAAEDAVIDQIRDDLMEHRIDFAVALRRMACRLAGDRVVYFAHWITPVRSPRRFDPRFFAAQVRGATTPIVDPREMTDACWITPACALQRHAEGSLPMIRPTVRTLETLTDFNRTTEALEALSRETVVTILPD